MTAESPEVSVVIPAFNEVDTIGVVIDRVLSGDVLKVVEI
jgi:glycosyltransferase involved in cell wall biosynthesis